MLQPHRGQKILGHREDIPQHVDFELVKCLVNIGFKQRLQLVEAILNLQLCLGVDNIAILVGVGDGGAVAGVREAQTLRRRVDQAGF